MSAGLVSCKTRDVRHGLDRMPITHADQGCYSLLRSPGSCDSASLETLRWLIMGDTVQDVAGQLRKLAVELVRSGKQADAAAVLAGIGAIEMLPMFADQTGAGASSQPSHSPGY
jgi:hypothetical protein